MAQKNQRSITRAVLAAGMVLALAWSAGPAQASPSKPLPAPGSHSFPAGTATDAAAAVIGQLGMTSFSDTFGGLYVEGRQGRLTVYATDLTRAKQLVAAGRAGLAARHRSVRIDVVDAPHTRAELIAAIGDVWKQKASLASSGVQLQSVAITKGASGLRARVSDVAKARSLLATKRIAASSGGGVHVDFERGAPPANLSRDDDFPPYYGGTPIKWDWDWSYRCTSAFGMLAGGTEYLMTADHCFDLNDNVEDPNGDDIGFTRIRNYRDDATGISGSDIGGGVFLSNTRVGVFQRASYSWTGQFVCQSGWTSAPEPVCAIQVQTDYVEWESSGGGIRRGVFGKLCDGCIAARAGDSGGPVWTTGADGVLESRGINSAGGVEIEDDAYQDLYWTETPHILGDFGGSLITTN